MKTYTVIIGEGNEELSNQVQDALKAVGLRACSGKYVGFDEPVLSINEFGLCGEFGIVGHGHKRRIAASDELLLPSYVLAHASELDGAKKPWEIPEEGQRFVTKDERLILTSEETADQTNLRRWNNHSRDWRPPVGDWDRNRAYTVPIGFTFAPEQVTISMDEIAAWQNVDVENLKVTK